MSWLSILIWWGVLGFVLVIIGNILVATNEVARKDWAKQMRHGHATARYLAFLILCGPLTWVFATAVYFLIEHLYDGNFDYFVDDVAGPEERDEHQDS